MSIPKVLGSAFLIEQLEWLFLKYVLVSEKNLKCVFALIMSFYVHIKELARMSTTTRAFVFPEKFAGFYDHRIFETRS